MQGAAFLVGEVIAFVVSDQPLLDARSETAHVFTVRVSELPGKPSHC